MDIATTYFNSVGLSVIIISGLLWFLRNSIQSWIWKQHSQEIEKYKSSLVTTTELLKFELQKDATRAQLFSNSIFSIYPDLFQKVRIARGIIGGIYGFRYSNTWDGYARPDFEKVLADKNIPTGFRDEVINAIEENRALGIKKLDELLWNLEFSEAHGALAELKNYYLLKEIFLSDPVKEFIEKIHKDLISAKVDADMSRRDNSRDYLRDMKSALDRVESSTAELAIQIRRELNPTDR